MNFFSGFLKHQETKRTVSKSHNIFVFQENRNYAGSPNDLGILSTADASTLREGLSGKTEDEVIRAVLGKSLGDIEEKSVSAIAQELEDRTFQLTTPSSTTDDQIPREHTRNTSKTIRLVDPRSAKEVEHMPPKFVRNDNVSGRTANSGRTSQCSKGKKVSKFPRLSIQKLRFPEPVEEHVETYMISRKRRFRDSRYVICLWDPFLSLDLPSDMQEKHCISGDVGVFNSTGGFDVMFNIFLSMEKNHKMNYNPPATFTPFISSDTESPIYTRDPGEESKFFMTCDLLRCHGGSDLQTRDATYSFRSIKHEENMPPYSGSAVLVTPTGCSATRINPGILSDIEEYLSNNIDSWYDRSNYQNGRHKALTNGSLNLISACYKSKVWAAAALHQPSITELTATLSRSTDSSPEDYEWNVHPAFETNHGSSKPDVPRNISYTVAVEVCALSCPTRSIFDRIGNVTGSIFSFRSKYENKNTSLARAQFSSFRNTTTAIPSTPVQ